jgi:uncharacterized protein (DUF1501 family)
MPAPQAILTGNGDQRRALIVIFLRGAADGLSLVAPVEDDAYFAARPRLAVAKKDAIALDGFFGMNPLLAPLKPAFDDGTLAIVHGAGSEDSTRSHFEAQDLMEHGGLVAGGWLGRFLRFRSETTAVIDRRYSTTALSAVALGKTLPECLRGAPSATVMQSLDEFSLGASAASFRRELERLYALERNGLGSAARDTFDALARLEKMRATIYQPANGAEYARDDFAQGLRQIARLIKARVGLEAASLDLGGWDSHFTQGTVINPLMMRLAGGLGAFYRDMGREMETTTVVVMTEFGRRVHENASFGTDHGRGSVMFAIGGGVKGGRVIANWSGLRDETLEGPGDLPVAHNYRNVLAPILTKHGADEASFAKVFPDFEIKPLALYA